MLDLVLKQFKYKKFRLDFEKLQYSGKKINLIGKQFRQIISLNFEISFNRLQLTALPATK